MLLQSCSTHTPAHSINTVYACIYGNCMSMSQIAWSICLRNVQAVASPAVLGCIRIAVSMNGWKCPVLNVDD